jgi:hypothetical protein
VLVPEGELGVGLADVENDRAVHVRASDLI